MNAKLLSLLLFLLALNRISAFKSSPDCNHLQPYMFNKLALGVDLIKLNLFPEKDEFFARNGWKDSIFNLTCYQNVEFTLPNLVIENEEITYHLPDYYSVDLRRANTHNLIAHRTFEADEEEYKQHMMQQLKVDSLNDEEKQTLNRFGYNSTNTDKLYIGALKLNHNYQTILKERISSRRMPIESRINITGYLINVNHSRLALSNAFQNEINNLPASYDDAVTRYEQMIATFGTHFFTRFLVGGLAKVSFKQPEEAPVQLDQLSEDQFKNDLPFDFDLTSDVEFDVDENMGSNVKYFLSDGKLHKRTIVFWGGRIQTHNHSLNKWKASVPLDPWLIGGELAPLSRLINDKQKKANFLRAMMSYLDKAEILNLKETVQLIEDELGNDQNWILPYKAKVDELNERQFVNHSNLVDLSVQMNDEIGARMRRRQAYANPANFGIYSSNLDELKTLHREKTNHANSNLVSCWLLFLIGILGLVRLIRH